METKRNRIGTGRQLLTFTAAMLLGGGIFGVAETLAATATVVTTPHTSYANIIGSPPGECGATNGPLCEVPAGKQLVIEHVSGYLFDTPTAFQNTATTMVVTDPALGLNGNGFHTFLATKINPKGGTNDVFVFNTPFKMLLGPGATYHFVEAANVSVSGYLEDAIK